MKDQEDGIIRSINAPIIVKNYFSLIGIIFAYNLAGCEFGAIGLRDLPQTKEDYSLGGLDRDIP